MADFIYDLKYFHSLSLLIFVIFSPSHMIDSNREAIEEINKRIEGLKVETNTYTDIFKESGTWINQRTDDITVSVMLFGGGSGGFGSAGGNGGQMTTWSGLIKAGEVVPITIGEGGADQKSGGTTSFGSHCSANGGSQTSGGTTGGGMTCNAGYGGTGGAFGYSVGGTQQ